LAKQRDGSVIAEFALDGTEEVKRWIMSFGKQATILEPAALRQDILAEMDALIEAYHSDHSAAEWTKPRNRPQPAVSSKG
jgi:predicted DNA-binding transcriptional regulator YafY